MRNLGNKLQTKAVSLFAGLLLQTVISGLIVGALSGCYQGSVDSFDRQNGATRNELKDLMYGNKTKNNSDKKSEPEIPSSTSVPKSSRIIAIPSLPQDSSEKLISFSVAEQVPLKDVFIELAKASKLDLDLDPNISGGVIINAKNRPLTEVLDRVCDMGNLRYTLSNGRLQVERDLPYAKNYLVDFLSEGGLWGDVEKNILAILSGSASADGNDSVGSVNSNKLANIMTVFASKKNHDRVASYLESVRRNASAQVLIEAKVVEVTLKDDYKTGIDWNWAKDGFTLSQSANGDNATAKNPISFVVPTSSGFLGGSISATINALEEFGTVKAISSPRINALNNQKATLNFTQKLVYFTTEASNSSTTSTSGTNNQNTVTSTKNEEPTGTELIITPVIDLVTQEITLNVKPKITIKSGEVTQEVPTVINGVSTTIKNQIPIINTRELTTIAKIKSGNVLVIGGVMSEAATNNDKGFPFIQSVPIVGNLFKSVNKTSDVNETVIFIKATIINTSDGVSKYDRKVHDAFSSSARPFFNSK